MPAQYEAIRDKFIGQGMDTKEAKTRAAKIYNAKNPGNPVGRYSEPDADQSGGPSDMDEDDIRTRIKKKLSNRSRRNTPARKQ
jgi:hypothetical protein